MSDVNGNSGIDRWTNTQAYTLGVICLLVGIAGGWFVRGSQSPAPVAEVASANTIAGSGATSAQPTPEQLKHMADKQAGSLLAQLKVEPDNSDLLARVGNIYYDAQQYPTAIDYYQRSLKMQPANASVRTDLATALWYIGTTDEAITEFNNALSYEPNKPNTLFNLGIVKWQGKMDIDGAVAAWQKLLDTNPNYEAKDKVVALIAQARKHAGVKPGTRAKTLGQ